MDHNRKVGRRAKSENTGVVVGGRDRPQTKANARGVEGGTEN